MCVTRVLRERDRQTQRERQRVDLENENAFKFVPGNYVSS